MADSPTRWTAPPPLLPGISIEYKLPLFLSTLLVTVIALSSWAAYSRVRDAAFTAARVRLTGVADQLASMLRTQARQVGASLAKAAANDTLRRFLETPTPQNRLDALAAMRHMGPVVEQVIGVELWSARRERLLVTGLQTASAVSGGQGEGVQWAERVDTGLVGRLQLGGDSLIYPVSALIQGPGGPLGYVVEWRRATSSPKSREATLQLIGSGAALYVGNDRGDFWTDLLGQAPKPPVDVRHTPGILTYERPQSGDGVHSQTQHRRAGDRGARARRGVGDGPPHRRAAARSHGRVGGDRRRRLLARRGRRAPGRGREARRGIHDDGAPRAGRADPARGPGARAHRRARGAQRGARGVRLFDLARPARAAARDA